jgi:hypothetical protein
MGIDYSKLNKLIIPKHKDHHWALIVVNFPEKTFEYYDSLSEENVDHDIKVNPLILQQNLFLRLFNNSSLISTSIRKIGSQPSLIVPNNPISSIVVFLPAFTVIFK